MFDPNMFLNSEVTGEMETQYSPIPEGEYNAFIEKVEPRVTTTGRAIMDVHWKVDAPGNEEANERQVRQSIFLDLTEQGTLDRGKNKNVQLGRLRDALSQNGPQPWNPGMLSGGVAKVLVKHRAGDDGAIFTDVKGVTKI
jgi:hypothetical protein